MAVNLQNSDVAKSIANDTNKKMVSSQPHTSSDMSTKSDESDQQHITYKVGDYVRATYDSDNIDYEAQVISINEDVDECVIKFIGYGNEKTVRLVDLDDSWGEEERRIQEENAAANVEKSNDDSENDSSSKHCSLCETKLTSSEFIDHLCIDREKIVCPLCSVSTQFESTISFLQHIVLHRETVQVYDGKLLYQCDECNVAYPNKILLECHKKSHGHKNQQPKTLNLQIEHAMS